MHKILTLFLFLASTTFCFSQSIKLKGKVLDSDDTPLEAATVYLTSVKDSTLVDYTITDKNGNWEIKTRAITQPVYLKVSFMGKAEYKQQFDIIDQDKDFGTIKLEEQGTQMDELLIKADIPPIRIKQDTLEFDAASFKVRPDANVEALLKQLPGVEIDDEGKITVNGKEVNKILVNGKPFFDENGQIALQNLPAELINKVQVTDTKTKKEELTGQKGSGENATINLTIDEDKNKGLMGRIMGGYGSNDRYEGSGLVNYFKGPTKVSVLASSNNINSSGFSMNEIFDSMGGGRNVRSMWVGSNGSFGINGMEFGTNTGIARSNIIGVNYSDEWTKDFDGNLGYFYSSSNTDNTNRSDSQIFLPEAEDSDNPGVLVDQSYRRQSNSTTNQEQFAHSFNSQLNVKIDSTQTFYFEPKFTYANSKNKGSSSQFSERIIDGRQMNDSESDTYSESDNYTFSSNFVWTKSFKNQKKGRVLSFEFNNENRKDDGSNFNKSTTNRYLYDGGTQTTIVDNRNQIRYNRQATDEYSGKLEFTEPVTDSLQLTLSTEYKLERWLEDRDGYDYDAATGGYTSYNDPLSNYLSSKVNTILPVAGLHINTKKIWAVLEGGAQFSKFGAGSEYLGENYSFNKNYVLPWVHANLSYHFAKSQSLWASYSYSSRFPSASQVLPVEDVSNPLYTTIGNPDIDPQRTHNINMNFNDFDYATRSGYGVYLGVNFTDNQITNLSEIDDSGKTTSTYTNVAGNYYTYMGVNWNKTIKKDAHKYRLRIGFNNSYSVNKAFTNSIMYTGKGLELGPELKFAYEYGDLLVISPSYEYKYSTTHYENYSIATASNFTHHLNLETTSYWPKHFVFGNDFGYTYNSQLGAGFKKDFYLWNTSLGYNFLQDRMLFKVKVYDLLNQNLGTSRTISATSIVDQQNTVLKRYVMFSLTFKFDKFGGKKKEDEGGFWFW